ncbi:hypothetical protein G8759_00200 [Spirosoma aureum]|uniref:Lipoprotein n=1 Tax=Spirosoma aureum TaxID=2692134 RepID=A0A6G9AFT6_9BACT|nr:hypothetical protein [Spirosoma aureum]QIP11176.1 hypothetical protein G8759_00200 [Spirosoma aureum]
MATSKLLTSLCLASAVGITSCVSNRIVLPEPAQTISGTYEAQANNAVVPIQGETFRLTIERVATDRVDVALVATVNGQLGDSLVYKSAQVGQQVIRTDLQGGCVSYSIKLISTRAVGLLTMTCEEINVFQYKMDGQQGTESLKFRKL